jgi:hypothetical protein
MDSKFLLPNRFKMVGLIMFIPSAILGILSMMDIEFKINILVFKIWVGEIFKPTQFLIIQKEDIYNEILAIFIIISLVLVGFSKEKNEDEYINKIRLDSLLWAVIINYALLMLAVIFIYGNPFFTILIYNMFTVLILFVARFNFVLYLNRRQFDNEK